jgi:hypothetical protein
VPAVFEPAAGNGHIEPQVAEAPESVGEEPAAAEVPAEPDGTHIRIHELARELGVSSRDVLSRCGPEVQAKSHMSSVTNKAAAFIRRVFGIGPAEPPAGEPEPTHEPDLDRAPVAAAWEAAPPEERSETAAEGTAPEERAAGERPPRRPRGGRGRRRGGRSRTEAASAGGPPPEEAARVEGVEAREPDAAPSGRRSRRRRRKSRSPMGQGAAPEGVAPQDDSRRHANATDRPAEPRGDEGGTGDNGRGRDGRKRKRRRGSGRSSAEPRPERAIGDESPSRPVTPVAAAPAGIAGTSEPRPRRGLYRSRRPLQRGAVPAAEDE